MADWQAISLPHQVYPSSVGQADSLPFPAIEQFFYKLLGVYFFEHPLNAHGRPLYSVDRRTNLWQPAGISRKFHSRAHAMINLWIDGKVYAGQRFEQSFEISRVHGN